MEYKCIYIVELVKPPWFEKSAMQIKVMIITISAAVMFSISSFIDGLQAARFADTPFELRKAK